MSLPQDTQGTTVGGERSGNSILEFDYAVEPEHGHWKIVIYKNSQTASTDETSQLVELWRESEVFEWLKNTNGSFRLVILKNWTRYPHPKFPTTLETLEGLLAEWKFPPLDGVFENALYVGGFNVWKHEKKRTSMAWTFLGFSSHFIVNKFIDSLFVLILCSCLIVPFHPAYSC